MGFLFLWTILAILVGMFATDRAMGFWGGFLWSLLLSPLIGFIIVVASKSKKQQLLENQMLINQQQQTNVLHQMQQASSHANQISLADELAKLKSQLDQGVITQDEFQTLKGKLIARMD